MNLRQIITIISIILLSLGANAQENKTLITLVNVAKKLQVAKNKNDYNQAVTTLSAFNIPTITLMDDLTADDKKNEYHGVDADKFRFNAVIGYAYNNKKGFNKSKGNYFDSRQKDIFYSVIEKTIDKNKTTTYTLTEHSGKQEFVIMPYDNNSLFEATIIYDGKTFNGEKNSNGNNYRSYIIPKVDSDKKITIKIDNKSGKPESFVIMNHNVKDE